MNSSSAEHLSNIRVPAPGDGRRWASCRHNARCPGHIQRRVCGAAGPCVHPARPGTWTAAQDHHPCLGEPMVGGRERALVCW